MSSKFTAPCNRVERETFKRSFRMDQGCYQGSGLSGKLVLDKRMSLAPLFHPAPPPPLSLLSTFVMVDSARSSPTWLDLRFLSLQNCKK
jgi:hypothetical protein